jgi:hypothetical protein
LALLLVIGVGAAVVWSCVATFVTGGLFGQRQIGRVVEGITVLSDGEALITGTRYGFTAVEQLPARKLDRSLAACGDRTAAPVVRFYRHWLDNNQLNTTNAYAVRVLQVGDSRLELAGQFELARWYAVRDDSDEGRVYLVGYDVRSKLLLGYIGRNGFTNSLPDPVDKFLVRDLPRQAATTSLSRGDRGTSVGYAYLLDGDRLVEIDTIARTVREMAVLPEALMMEVGVRTTMSDSDQVAGEMLTSTERVLVVWQGDRLAAVDPKSGDVVSYRLPEDVRDAESFAIHLVGPDAAVVEHYRSLYDFSTVRLLWTSAAGDVTREETVKLSGYSRPDERIEGIQATALVPVPLLLGTLMAVFAPQSPWHEGKSFGEAFAAVLAAVWPPLVALLVVSAALAWWTWTVHRRDGRPYAALWAGLVFLFGPAAWLAYAVERRPTPQSACPACGARSPRNRVDCAACGEDAFQPRPLGAEVFA